MKKERPIHNIKQKQDEKKHTHGAHIGGYLSIVLRSFSKALPYCIKYKRIENVPYPIIKRNSNVQTLQLLHLIINILLHYLLDMFVDRCGCWHSHIGHGT